MGVIRGFVGVDIGMHEESKLSIDITCSILKGWVDNVHYIDRNVIRQLDEDMLLGGFSQYCSRFDYYRTILQSIYDYYYDEGKLVTLVKSLKSNSINHKEVFDMLTFKGTIEGKFEL